MAFPLGTVAETSTGTGPTPLSCRCHPGAGWLRLLESWQQGEEGPGTPLSLPLLPPASVAHRSFPGLIPPPLGTPDTHRQAPASPHPALCDYSQGHRSAAPVWPRLPDKARERGPALPRGMLGPGPHPWLTWRCWRCSGSRGRGGEGGGTTLFAHGEHTGSLMLVLTPGQLQ